MREKLNLRVLCYVNWKLHTILLLIFLYTSVEKEKNEIFSDGRLSVVKA